MKYHELSEEAKDKAREWWRGCVHSDSWYAGCVTEDWKQILEHLGFFDVDIYWSGFGSQGDGACFTGSWRDRYVEYDKLVEMLGEEKAKEYGEFFHKMKVFRDMEIIGAHCVTLSHRGHYCHESSICYDFDIPNDDEGPLPDFEENFKEACQYLMRKIYRQLEDEYEYQMSDEAVAEAIECNEYDFNEEGEVK